MARARRGPSHAGVEFPRVAIIQNPTAEQVRRDIILLQEQIGDYNKPLQHSKQVIIGDVRRAFLTETDPVEGRKWPQLSISAARVPRFGILRRQQTNAKLYRAMVNRFNYGVTKEGVYLNNARIPRYAVYHQQDESTGTGVPRISKEAVRVEMLRIHRSGFAKGQPDRAKIIARTAVENVAQEAREKLRDQGGSRIPQRRFLGPSQPAQNMMVETFDQWAKEAIIIYKRGNALVKARRPGL